MKLLRVLLLLAAAAASVAVAQDASGSEGGSSLTPTSSAPASHAPSPSPRLTSAPTTAPPKTPAPTDKGDDGSDGSASAGITPVPSSVAPTPSPKNNRTSSASNRTEEPVATVKTRASVVTALTPAPAAGDAGTTGEAALDSDAINSEYGTKSPTSGDETEVSTSSSGGSSGGWMVPVIVGCVIVSALVVVTFYVRSKRRDDDDDDDDDHVDDFQRRTNNFFQHPRTTNHNVQTIAHDPEPPLFKPKPEVSSVPLNAVSVQPATRSPRKFSIPMLQSPQRTSGDSLDGRDAVSQQVIQQHNIVRVTSPNSLHDERISARFTSASMSGVTL